MIELLKLLAILTVLLAGAAVHRFGVLVYRSFRKHLKEG